MTKRYRVPMVKPGQLKVSYGKIPHENPDVLYSHGGNGASRPDARLLSHFFEGITYLEGRSLRQELEHRGYDIKTMKFTIQVKKPQ